VNIIKNICDEFQFHGDLYRGLCILKFLTFDLTTWPLGHMCNLMYFSLIWGVMRIMYIDFQFNWSMSPD